MANRRMRLPAPVEQAGGPRAFLAFPSMEDYLEREFTERFRAPPDAIQSAARWGSLYCFDSPPPRLKDAVPWWAKTVFLEPFTFSFDSIADGAAALRQKSGLWAPYFFTCFRRGALIQEKLPHVPLKARTFPAFIPAANIGCYTLLDSHRILASKTTSSPLPAGNIAFQEDHENPPSRAYLKLQEALSLLYSRGVPLPQPGTRCLDAGASPGGWTWLLSEMGAEVLCVDRTAPDERLLRSPRVSFLKRDAFALVPEETGPWDWVFSDVACYPSRLLGWIRRWLESGMARRMVCTIKLQGKIDWELLAEFDAIPGGEVRRLNYNKHELTWLYSTEEP